MIGELINQALNGGIKHTFEEFDKHKGTPEHEQVKRNVYGYTEVKTINRFPLIELVTFYTPKVGGGMHSSRHVRRSDKYKHKWYAKYLPYLYARQVAKAFNFARTRKGKGLMDMPYSIDNIFDDEIIEKVYLGTIIDINSEAGYAQKKGFKKKKVEIDAIDIMQADIEAEDDK